MPSHVDRVDQIALADGTLVDSTHPLPTSAGATVADGANVVEGTTNDGAITTNTTGTISGKLRGLVAIFADIWNSTSHYFNVNLSTLIAGEDQTNNRMRTF